MADQAEPWGIDWARLGWPFITTTSGTNYPIIAGAADDEADGDADEDADDTEVEDEEDSDEDDDSEDSSEDTPKTFTQEQVNRMNARERKRAMRKAVDFKEAGFASKKELLDFIAAAKESKDGKDDDADQKAKDEVEAAKKAAVEGVLSKADERLVKADFRVAARDAGIPKERLDDAYALARTLDEWDDVEVEDDDTVAGLDEEFFTALKEKKSYLFSSASSDDDEDDEDRPPSVGTRSKGKGDKGAQARRKKLMERYTGLTPVSN